jgi:hypothetical protein
MPADKPTRHLFERFLLCFAFCYLILYHGPFALSSIPGLSILAKLYMQMWAFVIASLAHVDPIPVHTANNGDTPFGYIRQAVDISIALAAGIVWTLLDRRKPNTIALRGWLHLLARYVLALSLFSYAMAKVIPTQFIHLQNRQLNETYGQSSPMGLLWNFMGFSTAYTIFGGLAELVPAALLIFRRTALAGALLSFAVLLNVVMLNLCYDVPVKLYSINLLFLSTTLILPESQRLFRFFMLNQPTSPSNLREPAVSNSRLQWLAMGLKFGILTFVVFHSVSSSIVSHRKYASLAPPRPSQLTSRGFHWLQENPYNR